MFCVRSILYLNQYISFIFDIICLLQRLVRLTHEEREKKRPESPEWALFALTVERMSVRAWAYLHTWNFSSVFPLLSFCDCMGSQLRNNENCFNYIIIIILLLQFSVAKIDSNGIVDIMSSTLSLKSLMCGMASEPQCIIIEWDDIQKYSKKK